MSITIETLKESMRRQHPDYKIDDTNPGAWDYLLILINQNAYSLQFVLERMYDVFGEQMSVTLGQVLTQFHTS